MKRKFAEVLHTHAAFYFELNSKQEKLISDLAKSLKINDNILSGMFPRFYELNNKMCQVNHCLVLMCRERKIHYLYSR